MKANQIKTIALFLSFILLGFSFSSCKDEDNIKPSPINNTSRVIRYELTGTYSGTLILSYSNAQGLNQVEDNVTLPWVKEVTVDNGVMAVGVGAGSETSGFGMSGETITGNIYRGGEKKSTSTVYTTSSGYISLPTITLSL